MAPQLLDTGLAHLKPLAAVPGSAAQLSSKALPLYKSPEQVTGDLQAVGPWSDIYSAAACAFHLLGGRPPFIGSTAQELAHQHLHAVVPELTELRPDVHPTVAKVIVQGLAKRPADRFDSMAAFLKAFRSASSRPAPTLRGATAVPPEGAFSVGAPAVAPVAPAVAPVAPAVAPVAPVVASVAPAVVPVASVAPAPVAPQAAPVAGPPPTVHLGQSPWQDRTPPPTMRLDAGQAPQFGAVPVPVAAPPPGVGYASASAPPGLVAPLPPVMAPAGGAPRRGVGVWVAFIVAGVLLVIGVVVGLIIALGSGGNKAVKDEAVVADRKPDAPMVVPAMTVTIAPPAMAVASRPPPVLPKADRYRVDIRNRPWKGADHARATVVLFCGFSGYYCRSSRDNFRRIVSDYPQDVKLVWMDYPLHYYKRSMPASVAAAEVYAQRGRAGFWKMHDNLYGNPYHHTDDNLVKWAAEAGADSVKVRAAITAQKHQAAIKAIVAKGQDIGATYTPTVFVNGIRISDAKSYDGLKARVVSEIALAKRTIGAGGATLKGYYAHTQKNGLRKKRSTLGLGRYKPPKPYKPRKPFKPFSSLLNTVYYVPVTPKSPQRGPADALVTVVLFGDFQCPFTFRVTCALRAVLGKPIKDVRLVWMNNPRPYHSRALQAAEAAMEGFAQRKSLGFWAMHDRIFPMDLCKPDGRYRLGFFRRRDKLSDADLLAKARKARLSVGRFRRALSAHTHKSRILSEQKLAKGHYAYSTPTMFINGKKFTGTKTVSELTALVGQARRDARLTLTSKRVSKAKLYETIIAAGRRPRGWP